MVMTQFGDSNKSLATMSQGISPIIHLNEKQNGETSGDRGKKKAKKRETD
jgi:hypothetical protein